MREQRILDLARTDFVAAGLDQVGRHPPEQSQAGRGGVSPEVTGTEPSVVRVSRRGRLRPTEVPVEQSRTTQLYFAEPGLVAIGDAQLDARKRVTDVTRLARPGHA